MRPRGTHAELGAARPDRSTLIVNQRRSLDVALGVIRFARSTIDRGLPGAGRLRGDDALDALHLGLQYNLHSRARNGDPATLRARSPRARRMPWPFIAFSALIVLAWIATMIWLARGFRRGRLLPEETPARRPPRRDLEL